MLIASVSDAVSAGLALPPSIPVKQLLGCTPGNPSNLHHDYDYEKLELFEGLYKGGEEFHANLRNRCLWTRPIETSKPELRKHRLSLATYTPYVAGVIDYVKSQVVNAEIQLEVYDGETQLTKDDPRAEYYLKLNSNCDGAGRSLPQVAGETLLHGLLYGRGGLGIVFPASAIEPLSLAAAKDAGLTDACLVTVEPELIDDWETDDAGAWLWFRTHRCECLRTKADVGGPDTERHTWTWYTPDEMVEYHAESPIVDGKVLPFDDKAVATRTREAKAVIPGQLPYVPLQVPEGAHIMERLAEPALKIWNEEAERTYIGQICCHPIPYVATDDNMESLSLAAGFAIRVHKGDQVGFIQPDPGIFTAMGDQVKADIAGLFSAVQATALMLAQRDTQGRMSGKAKETEYGAMDGLHRVLRRALRDCLMEALTVVQKYRGDEALTLELDGLDDHDEDAEGESTAPPEPLKPKSEPVPAGTSPAAVVKPTGETESV